MKTIFGVDSHTPANKRLTNGYTMYDWIMRQRCFPAFWGCTLTGEGAVTVEEIEFLRSKDCKIMLVVRDLTEVQVSRTSGAADGRRVAEAAKALGIPQHQGIAIFAEIKPDWSVNHNWMISFAQVLVSEGYCPGFIGNTDSSKNFNFDRQCSHYVQATKNIGQFGAAYCATEPQLSDMPKVWQPYSPSALKPEEMHLWACGKTYFNDLEATDVYARDEKVLAFMW